MDRNAISLQINSLRLFLVQALVLAVALRRLQVSQLWAVALCPPANLEPGEIAREELLRFTVRQRTTRRRQRNIRVANKR